MCRAGCRSASMVQQPSTREGGVGAASAPGAWSVVVFCLADMTSPFAWGSKLREEGADWKSAISWSSGGRRAIRGRENSYRDHLSPVADRAFTQRLPGQFFVEIAVAGFVLRLDDPG